jgi:hypothetical protein
MLPLSTHISPVLFLVTLLAVVFSNTFSLAFQLFPSIILFSSCCCSVDGMLASSQSFRSRLTQRSAATIFSSTRTTFVAFTSQHQPITQGRHCRFAVTALGYYTAATTTTLVVEDSTKTSFRHQKRQQQPSFACSTANRHSTTSTRLFATDSDRNNIDKRANLPFSVMDKGIERFTAAIQQNAGANGTATVTSNDKRSSVSDYEMWVRRLYATNLFHPVKMGLENIQQLHEVRGNSMNEDCTAIVHIAGTNGKGVVALKIAKTFEAASPNSLKVGLFCSPHITTALAFSFFASQGCEVVVLETSRLGNWFGWTVGCDKRCSRTSDICHYIHCVGTYPDFR